MTDGRAKNGGARKGAGRKSKREEDDLQQLLHQCVSNQDREGILKQLAQDAQSQVFRIRNEARKLLMAYLWGKPIERHEVTGKDGKDLQQPTLNLTINGPRTPSQTG